MVNFTDSRIKESSGLAASGTYPVLWTINDDGNLVFAVNTSTGNTVATFSVKGAGDEFEAICLDHKRRLWVCAIGDNNANKPYVSVFVRGEQVPNKNYGTLGCTTYKLAYPGGPRNAESFFVHPTTSVAYIISKQASSALYRLPTVLRTDRTNTLTLVNSSMGADVSDAAITPDGRFLLTRRKDQNTTVYVHRTTDWAQVDTITVPSLAKPEGITVAANQLSFWISSEGQFSRLYNVSMPSAYRPLPAATVAAPVVPATPCG